MTIENELKSRISSIELSQEQLKNNLEYDTETGIFYRIKTGQIAGCENTDGYISISLGGKRYLAHRLAWLYVYGYDTPRYIDHIDQIRSHNWITNLREASSAQNNINQGPQINNILGVKGIKRHGNKFVARITYDKVTHYLGLYSTIEEAICAREEAEIKFYGIFATKAKA